MMVPAAAPPEKMICWPPLSIVPIAVPPELTTCVPVLKPLPTAVAPMAVAPELTY
jgi:hypothetical protein